MAIILQILDIIQTKTDIVWMVWRSVCMCVCVCVCVMSTESSTSFVASQQIDNEMCWLSTFTQNLDFV